VKDKSVSVALATCNGATHLGEQLTDLAAQSLAPLELVVCDDASDDDTLAIVTEFAGQAPFPVHVHRNPTRLGYRANFLRCAGLCHGDLIAFCDQDDRWSPLKLETVVDAFDDPSTMLVFHNAEVVSANGGDPMGRISTNLRRTRWPPLAGAPWMFALGFTQVFRRRLTTFDFLWGESLDQNFDEEPLAHDQWYFFLASVLGDIVYLPDVLAHYRQHSGNAFGWTGLSWSAFGRATGHSRTAGLAVARRADAAQARASILQKAADTLEEPPRERLLQASRSYSDFARLYRLRAMLYEAEGLRARATAFRELLRARFYGGNPWQIGRLGLAMDCMLGLTGFQSLGKR
jgi:hypothetical protein